MISIVRKQASMIPNQGVLDMILLGESDPLAREECFLFMKPFLRFPNPVCPQK